MLKKSLFAITVAGLLASMAMAGDEVIWRREQCTWPWIKCYEPLDLCKVPVYIKIGYYVEVSDCKKLKIMMAPSGKDYVGCTKFHIRSNFDMRIGSRLVLEAVALTIKGAGDWSSWVKDPTYQPASFSTFVEHEVCVKVKEPNIKAILASHDEVKVADVWITVKPVCETGGSW